MCSDNTGITGYYFVGLLINQIVTNLYYDFYFTIFTFDIISVIVIGKSMNIIIKYYIKRKTFDFQIPQDGFDIYKRYVEEMKQKVRRKSK